MHLEYSAGQPEPCGQQVLDLKGHEDMRPVIFATAGKNRHQLSCRHAGPCAGGIRRTQISGHTQRL